jgi:5-hydroxyisourate hydrolase
MKIVPVVLDSTYGRAAAGISAVLTRADGLSWEPLAQAESGQRGCIEEWRGLDLGHGSYRITFNCNVYFSSLGELAAYPEASVSFSSRAELETLWIRLTLSPFSYTVNFAIC